VFWIAASRKNFDEAQRLIVFKAIIQGSRFHWVKIAASLRRARQLFQILV
jgi:hypothetical protein